MVVRRDSPERNGDKGRVLGTSTGGDDPSYLLTSTLFTDRVWWDTNFSPTQSRCPSHNSGFTRSSRPSPLFYGISTETRSLKLF